jgi:hypothetical protein
MLESINEQIDVLVAFTRQRVMPLSFDWGGRKYCVNQINMVHSSRVGQAKLYHFSVSSDDNYFQLTFDTERNAWCLAASSFSPTAE